MKKLKLIIVSILLFIFTMDVNASSFGISVGSKSITKGGKTTLKITGSDAIGRFNIKSSNSSVVAISEDRAWIENNSYTITLSALSVGTSVITVTPADVVNKDGANANLGAKSITINVSLPREKSKNNFLKSLKVDNYELVPAFDKNTLEYNVSVPATTEKINIGASAEDKYASVKGTGEFPVELGINTFEITCTSETGVVKTYAVTVTVEDLNPINVTVDKKNYTVVKLEKNLTMPANYISKSISIEGITVPSFYNETAKLTLVGLKDEEGNISLFKYDNNKYEKYVEIISGNIQFTPSKITNSIPDYNIFKIKINDSSVEALKILKSSNYSILYGTNITDGTKGYYMYDEKNNSLVRYNDDLDSKLREEIKLKNTIILAISSVLGVLFILVVVLLISNAKKNKVMKKYLLDHDKKDGKKEIEKKEKIEQKKEK